MTMNPSNNGRSGSGGGNSSVQDHYSLRWNNHQNHILRAFDALLQTKTLVDVTLVCAETSIRAHKMVLSACSPFFQRVFAETPCKHPVIVLKDFRGWVVQAIVDFMYRGEISVPQERLQTLIQAGESLQVRGLVENSVPDNTPTPAASPDDFENLIDTAEYMERCSSPDEESPSMVTSNSKIVLPSTLFSTATSDDQDNLCTSPPMPLRRKQARPRRRSSDEPITPNKPTTPSTPIMCKVKSEFMSTENKDDESKSEADIPESSLDGEHNESSNNPTDTLNLSAAAIDAEDDVNDGDDNITDGPENLCTKRAKIDDDIIDYKNNNTLSHSKNLNTNKNNNRIILSLKDIRQLHKAPHQMVRSPQFSTGPSPSKRGDDSKHDGIHSMDSDNPFSFEQMDLSMAAAAAAAAAQHHQNQLNASSLLGHMTNQVLQHGPSGGHERLEDAVNRMSKEFTPTSPMNITPMNFGSSDGPPHHPPSPLPFPGMSGQMSALGLTPPHMFGLDSPLGLFPPGMDPAKMFNPLMDMSDPRGMSGDHPPFLKKKIPRPKGQHSAPRGGPPRSWTNAELTEALQHVWNKKMTTSQASRIFGIPYNSLLMYVRGKYGKSLKLEQLRKDCISGPSVELLTMGMSGSSSGGNNNNSKASKETSDSGSSAPSNPSSHQRSSSSEQSNEMLQGSNPSNSIFNPFPPNFYPDFPGGFPGLPLGMLNLLPPERQQSQGSVGHIDEDCKSDRSKQSIEEDYPSQPLALNRSSGEDSQQSQSRSTAVINGANQD